MIDRVKRRRRSSRRLGERGFEVITPLESRQRAGIVNFRPPADVEKGDQATRFRKVLSESDVKVNLRGGGGVRVSCHFFNTQEDIDEMLRVVKAAIH